MRYADLATGGRELATALERHAGDADTIVLGIVRGGVPAAIAVARHLALPVDLILSRAVLQKPSGGFARASRVASTVVLDEELSVLRDAPPSPGKWAVDEALRALEVREEQCRGERAPVAVGGKRVLLVDCGMRTGGTMVAAASAVRRTGAASVIGAVPIAASAACSVARNALDDLVCLSAPEVLGNVGMGYVRFDVPDETAIRGLVESYRP